AVAIGNGPLGPPAQVAEEIALDLAPRQRLDIGKGQAAPETGGGEAIGEAPAEGERCAIGSVPMANVAGKLPGTVAISRGAGVVAAVEGRVDQPVIVHGEGDIMVDPRDRAIAIPAIAEIEGVEVIEIGFGQRAVKFDAALLEAEIDQDAEEFPVIVDIF